MGLGMEGGEGKHDVVYGGVGVSGRKDTGEERRGVGVGVL